MSAKTFFLWVVFVGLCLFSVANAKAQDCIDTELVLLADVSQSMTAEDRRIQREGYAKAFRSPQVIEQIKATSCGAIAVQYVEWNEKQTIIADWTIIAEPAHGLMFAAKIEAAPNDHTGGMTGFAAAMEFAAQQILNNEIEANWRVVDVSSDGTNTSGPSPSPTRDKYTSGPIWEQITFNGLPIFKGQIYRDGQRGFFEKEVVGGPRSFVADSINIENLHEAIIRKIQAEIG